MRTITYCLLLILFCCSHFGMYAQQDSIPDNVFVLKPADYDASLLRYWAHVAPVSVQFRHDSIIVDSNRYHPIFLPTVLPLDKLLWYEGTKRDTVYELSLKRDNYTNLTFTLESFFEEDSYTEWAGTAILEPQFYLAVSGIYENDKGEIYGTNLYSYVSDEGWKVHLLVPGGTKEWAGVAIDFGSEIVQIGLDKLGFK